MHPISSANSPEALERLARRRVAAKMGWLMHALVYVCVNAGLALIAWHTGRAWHLYPLVGWGLGLAVWLGSGTDLYQRLLEAERKKLQHRSRR